MSTGEQTYMRTLARRGREARVRAHCGLAMPCDPAVIELGSLAEQRLARAGRHLELVR